MLPHIHLYVYLLPKAGKNSHQPVDGETVELHVADAREVGGGDAGRGGGGPHRQLPGIENLDDLGGEHRLELFGIGIGGAEIAEQITAAARRCSHV